MNDDDGDDDDDGYRDDGDSIEVLLVHYLVHELQPRLDGRELLFIVLGHGQDEVDCDGVFDFLARTYGGKYHV